MTETLDDLDEFRVRARAWALASLPPRDDASLDDRELQCRLFDAGYAGFAMPREYGGAGLTLQHQQVFYDECAFDRRVPIAFSTSVAILGATLLDEGSETLRRRHLPSILRGDERWIQLLSEPGGGSDMAAALTRLDRAGDEYVLNGAKIWSTGALDADWGMCLARTDFSRPKHQGLSMIAVPLRDAPGVTIQPIRYATGEQAEFCQEFFDDVRLPLDHLIGAENDGWRVARTLLAHERLAAGGAGHGYGLTLRSSGEGGPPTAWPSTLVTQVNGRADASRLARLVADAYIERTVSRFANDRIMTGIRTGILVGAWGSLLKLHLGVNAPRESKIALAVHAADGVIWDDDEDAFDHAGEHWLISRGPSLGGGSNEMQRNTVSEQLLGLPREPATDRDLPFDEVLERRRRQ
jgi:alkylation response protein AidB-like acyl-CoA dehydrogenase